MASPSSSQKRITRSQARLSASKPEKPPLSAGSASKKKTDRKVLADVTNDSPITGLAPAMAKTGNTRRSLAAEESKGTPGGEDALRSQVKLLLQKVETEIHKAPSLRTLSHINCFLSSPSRLAAPTPLNTPATAGASPSSPASVSSPRRIPFANLEEPSLPMFVDLGVSSPRANAKAQTASPTIHCGFSTESKTPVTVPSPRRISFVNLDASGLPIFVDSGNSSPRSATMQTPSVQCTGSDWSQRTESGPASSAEGYPATEIQEVIDAEEAQVRVNDFLGNPVTRALQFFSPEKSPTEITVSSISAPASSESSPVRPVRDFEDDANSEWSVLVNVDSPRDMPGKFDLPARDVAAGGHVLKPSDLSSDWQDKDNPNEGNKLELLWAERSGFHPRVEEVCNGCESEAYHSEENEEECNSETDYSEEEFKEGQEIDDCEELCRGLSGMTVKEGSKGLPELKGTHTLFIYNSDDEIEEEMVISTKAATKEEKSPNVMRLKGLPTPKGKHLRFPEDGGA